MRVGIAGVDEKQRIKQAQIGIAGEARGKSEAAARFGVSGLNDSQIIQTGQFGVSGLSTQSNVAIAGANTNPIIAGAMGVSGNINGKQHELVDVSAIKRRDDALAAISHESNRLGDRAARHSWRRGVWFADFTYVMKKNGDWREGREHVFARPYRQLPFFIDSCGFRRVITGTAPKWAMPFEVYPMAIENLDPDGYASWDDPNDIGVSMKYLGELMRLFPGDSRLWPVFSIRWTWDDSAHMNSTPGWAGSNLAHLIPMTRTQRQFKDETRANWARLAIANAILTAQHPDFRWMVDTFGKVMIGGMVQSQCPRSARHLYAATLSHLFPDCHFWLLGQANFACVNGLGRLGLLEKIWTDGTWWIKDATAERFAIVEDGLITMHSFESDYRQQTFFTLIEMMAANLRSLLAAYEGLWIWPPPEPFPLDFMDINQVVEMKERFQSAQMELGL